jgi:hypothetical protein
MEWWSAETVATIVDLRQVQIVGFFWRDWREVQCGRGLGIGEGALPVRHSLVHPDDFLPQGDVGSPRAARMCQNRKAYSRPRIRHVLAFVNNGSRGRDPSRAMGSS